MTFNRLRNHSHHRSHNLSQAGLAPTIMVQGTASDVGKSIIVTALCRIFTQDGYRTAPFKSQNMSLNSYVTWDGKEIGRAQGMQADACRVAATTDMNPILLKPTRDMVSQVVVHGKPYKDLDARTYREKYLGEAETIVKEALNRLRRSFDLVVLEGAGSPAEVNLKDRDIVNMRLAGWADAPVLLVADIDRGGVFASIVGTMEILSPEERDRVRGFIINKFRGDVSLLKPGIEWLEQRTGKPVLGVVPYLPELGLEDEDSASLDAKGAGSRSSRAARERPDQLEVAVLRLPRISNFTDFDPLLHEPDVRLRYVSAASEWGDPDIVIIPGSKNTVEDLLYLRQSGLADKLLSHFGQGGWGVGICAGYQMLGRRLVDPDGVESDRPEVPGLGLFPAETVFACEKRTERVAGFVADGAWPDLAGQRLPSPGFATKHSAVAAAGPAVSGSHGSPCRISGYEIHMGRTRWLEPVRHPFSIRLEREPDVPASYRPEGIRTADGRLWGTYIHGILHNDAFRRNWLNAVRRSKGWPPIAETYPFGRRREEAFDRLADHVRGHLDMKRIYEWIGGGTK